jgi:hypothetical protein
LYLQLDLQNPITNVKREVYSNINFYVDLEYHTSHDWYDWPLMVKQQVTK